MVRRVVIVLVLLVLGIWIGWRWNIWFHNPAESAYVAAAVPSRVLLTFGDTDGRSRNVSWSCGAEVEEAFLELVDEDCGEERDTVQADGEVFRSRSGMAAYYVARLRGLQEGHAYRYRVWTGRKGSPWHTFRVQNERADGTAFLYVGDVQDTLAGVANQLIREAFRQHPEAEFLVCGGDLTERPTDAFWGETFAGLDSVGQTMPVLTVTGNHDYLKGVVGKLERRFSLIHSYFLDSMVGESQVFTVRYRDVQLFCLDSNRELPYLLRQRAWLKKQLAASEAKWKVVVLHHPLYSIRGSMNNLIQRWVFDDLIQEGGVDVVLQGHEHAYARMTQHEEGVATPPVYTVSHCSPKSYRIEFDELFDKFGSGSRYYQKVRTAGDTLYMTAYDACAQTLYDSLCIVKKGESVRIVDEGRRFAERIDFAPVPGSRADAAFAERIKAYKKRKNIKI